MNSCGLSELILPGTFTAGMWWMFKPLCWTGMQWFAAGAACEPVTHAGAASHARTKRKLTGRQSGSCRASCGEDTVFREVHQGAVENAQRAKKNKCNRGKKLVRCHKNGTDKIL
jgi:hypothetical protein